jgi:hypothetical protein
VIVACWSNLDGLWFQPDVSEAHKHLEKLSGHKQCHLHPRGGDLLQMRPLTRGSIVSGMHCLLKRKMMILHYSLICRKLRLKTSYWSHLRILMNPSVMLIDALLLYTVIYVVFLWYPFVYIFFLLLWIPLCYVEALLVLTFFCSCISAKLSFFPDVKLGINVPVRGESSHDLLKVDGDKNDYEWYGHLISHVALFLFYVLVMNIFCFICSAIWYTSFAMFVLFTVYYT